MTGRTVLAACRVIAVACYAAALFTPSRLLAFVELSLFGLLTVIIVAATRRLRTSRRPAFLFPRALPRARLGPRTRRPSDRERHYP